MNESTREVHVVHTGCVHGFFTDLIEDLNTINEQKPIDLVLITGDVGCFRDEEDLKGLSAPEKYHSVGTFKDEMDNLPYPIIFISGNHEPMNYLLEHKYGGELYPNFFYMGRCGAMTFKGVHIVGMSGIHYADHFSWPLLEEPPLNRDEEELYSSYHTRKWQFEALKEYCSRNKRKIDVFMTHDWPDFIENKEKASHTSRLKRKLDLHNAAATELFENHIRSDYYFAAHMHIAHFCFHKETNAKFAATTKYRENFKGKRIGRTIKSQTLIVEEQLFNTTQEFEFDPLWLEVLDEWRAYEKIEVSDYPN
ncbi:hypothetical protein PCE1_002270 [Barthelona sp. PCE]